MQTLDAKSYQQVSSELGYSVSSSEAVGIEWTRNQNSARCFTFHVVQDGKRIPPKYDSVLHQLVITSTQSAIAELSNCTNPTMVGRIHLAVEFLDGA